MDSTRKQPVGWLRVTTPFVIYIKKTGLVATEKAKKA
jgi:hypothetical protein